MYTPLITGALDTNFAHLLLGKDLRKLGNTHKAVAAVCDQHSFDQLFALLFHHERPLVMRAADAVEKITISNKHYLLPHKNQLLSILRSADHKELKWHVAQLLPRIPLSVEEAREVWFMLKHWCLNPNESRIVRVNALQGMFDLSLILPELKDDFVHTLRKIEHETVPSLQARMRKLKKKLEKA